MTSVIFIAAVLIAGTIDTMWVVGLFPAWLGYEEQGREIFISALMCFVAYDGLSMVARFQGVANGR